MQVIVLGEDTGGDGGETWEEDGEDDDNKRHLGVELDLADFFHVFTHLNIVCF